MMLNVWRTSESVCLTEPLRLRRLPNINRLRSPPSWPNIFVTFSPFWHDLQWNAPMKTAMTITTTVVGDIRKIKSKKFSLFFIVAKSSVLLLFAGRVIVWTNWRHNGTLCRFSMIKILFKSILMQRTAIAAVQVKKHY